MALRDVTLIECEQVFPVSKAGEVADQCIASRLSGRASAIRLLVVVFYLAAFEQEGDLPKMFPLGIEK
jgi:hypothetical protein